MENDDTGKGKLITGITQDARKEAESITRAAEKAAEEKREAARMQAENIRKDAEKKAREQVEEVKKHTVQSISTDIRRINLNTQKNLLNRIISEAEQKIEKMMSEEIYPEVLKKWIIEAALGLSVDEAEINASKKEMDMINPRLIEEAEKNIKDLTGRVMVLKKTKSSPLTAQGIVLTSANGKTAFNNQVHVRILRYQSQIRSIVNKKLFSEDMKGS